MNKIVCFLSITLTLLSCGENQGSQSAVSENSGLSRQQSPSTYAEISIKKGGEWQGQKYRGGTFTNVDEVVVPENHTDHSNYIRYEGPGWENRYVGYRLYLDWRNAIDIFGKKVDSLVLPNVGQDGFDSYHNNADWGMDILKAGSSLGIGGFGRYVNDTVGHFRQVGQTLARVENQEDKSIVEITYEDWQTGNKTIDLKAELTIFPEHRYTRAVLSPSEEIEGLTTGIVKFEDIPLIESQDLNSEWAYIATYGNQTLAGDEDKLGMAIFYQPSQVREIVEGKDDHLVVFESTSKDITYYFLGAWEQENNGITNREEFENYLDDVLEDLE